MPPARLVACLWLVGVTQSQVPHRADPPTPHPSLHKAPVPAPTRADATAAARASRAARAAAAARRAVAARSDAAFRRYRRATAKPRVAILLAGPPERHVAPGVNYSEQLIDHLVRPLAGAPRAFACAAGARIGERGGGEGGAAARRAPRGGCARGSRRRGRVPAPHVKS